MATFEDLGALKKMIDGEKLNYLLEKGFTITDIAEKGKLKIQYFI